MKIKDLPKINKRIKRSCSLCSKEIRVVVYQNHSYRGGHFFGRISSHPLPGRERDGVRVNNKASSPLVGEGRERGKTKSIEYWECPSCYGP